MWPNPQSPEDIVIFTEETLMENFILGVGQFAIVSLLHLARVSYFFPINGGLIA